MDCNPPTGLHAITAQKTINNSNFFKLLIPREGNYKLFWCL
jgi:hypothetical protein